MFSSKILNKKKNFLLVKSICNHIPAHLSFSLSSESYQNQPSCYTEAWHYIEITEGALA